MIKTRRMPVASHAVISLLFMLLAIPLANGVYTVNSFTPSNPFIDFGQNQTLNATWIGGTPPYSANFLVYANSVLIYNALYHSIGGTNNAITFTQQAAWAAGSFTANVVITDSGSNQVFNSITYHVGNTLTTPSNPAASSPLVGYNGVVTITSNLPTSGSAPYVYTWLVSYNNSAFTSDFNDSPAGLTYCGLDYYNAWGSPVDAGNIVSCSFSAINDIATPPGLYSFEVQMFDNATIAETTKSNPVTITLGPALLTEQPTPSNPIILGQNEIYSIFIANTMPPFYGSPGPYNVVLNGDGLLSVPTITVNSMAPGGITLTASFSYSGFDSASNFTVNATVTDTLTGNSTDTPAILTKVNGPYVPLSIQAPLSISASILDVGQSLGLSESVSNGVSPYSFNWIVVNSVSGAIVYDVLHTGVQLKFDNLTFQTPSYFISNSPLKANVIVTSNAVTSNSVYTSNFIVNLAPTLSTPIPNSTLLDYGQPITYNVVLSGGTGPFTVNLTEGGALVNSLAGQTAGTITFGANIPAAGSNTFNVIATDMGTTTPYVFNSVPNTMTVNSIPAATSLTPSNSAINFGDGVTFNVLISGGTGPFTLELVASNGFTVNTITGVSAGIRTFGTIIPQNNPSIYNVIGTDIGTSAPFTFSSESNTIIVNNAPPLIPTTTTTTTTTTVATTTVPGGSGNPGGPGGPTGTGGSLKPTATLSGSCYTITNMTALKGTNVTLDGMFIEIVTNFIGPTSAGVTVNNVSYTLTQGASPLPFSISGINYTIGLTTVTYLPILHTIQVNVCGPPSLSTPPANNTKGVLILNNSATLSTIPITSNSVTINIGFWPGRVSILLAANASNSVYLHLSNATLSVPGPPHGYINLVAVNLSTDNSVSGTSVVLGYNCAINHTRIVPFILANGIWDPITPFTTNSQSCTVSFAVPSDPIIGLMAKNQTVTTTTSITTTTTVVQSEPWQQPISGTDRYLIAAVVAAVVIIALLFEMRKIRGRRQTAGLIHHESWQSGRQIPVQRQNPLQGGQDLIIPPTDLPPPKPVEPPAPDRKDETGQ